MLHARLFTERAENVTFAMRWLGFEQRGAIEFGPTFVHQRNMDFQGGKSRPRRLTVRAAVSGQVRLTSIPESRGWGTWIRTKAARVRAGSSTAKLSPNGAGARPIARAPAASNQSLTQPIDAISRRSPVARG